MTSDYEHMRQKYASLEAQYFALVKAIADGLALQAPPRYVVSKDFTMPVEWTGSLEPGAIQTLVPSESVQFEPALLRVTSGAVTRDFRLVGYRTPRGSLYSTNMRPQDDCKPVYVIEDEREAPPIDMVLHCPVCHTQHIDAPDPVREDLSKLDTWKQVLYVQGWTNPPHRSHKCSGCGHIWRPADVCTNGVAAVKTVGKNDSPLVAAAPEIDECAANGNGHNFGPHGPHRERQCEWCGKAAPPVQDDWRRGLDAGDVLGGGY